MFIGIWVTNAVHFTKDIDSKERQTSVDGSGRWSALCLMLSMTNHRCSPEENAWQSTIDSHQVLQARKLIKKGEEITISYKDSLSTRDERRRIIKEQYGFDCICATCNSESDLARVFRCQNCRGPAWELPFGEKITYYGRVCPSNWKCIDCSVVLNEEARERALKDETLTDIQMLDTLGNKTSMLHPFHGKIIGALSKFARSSVNLKDDRALFIHHILNARTMHLYGKVDNPLIFTSLNEQAMYLTLQAPTNAETMAEAKSAVSVLNDLVKKMFLERDERRRRTQWFFEEISLENGGIFGSTKPFDFQLFNQINTEQPWK